ncbi:cystathionine gamma-synthase [Clostridia bacterium]|nr:cystathionine gamma-synthase [Clostridia bacterium]
MENKKFNTALIHGGFRFDKHTGAVNIPIYQTSTYAKKSVSESVCGYEYSRSGNPTRAALESLIAELEGGMRGFAFASGMAAVTAVLSIFKSGDTILVTDNVYGGTFRVLDKVFSHFGIKYKSIDTSKPENIENALTPDVAAIFVESPTNPLLTVTDLSAIAEIAKKHSILSIVDNTFMTPYLQKPLEQGIDIVVHSATKFLGGHSDLIAGLVVTKDDVLGERIGFVQNSTGGILQPFDSFLLIRGIKTLAVRMDRHIQNADKVAELLKNSPYADKVYHVGIPVVSFELSTSKNLDKFFDNLKILTLAESLGGIESLMCHPATMTHASIPKEMRDALGIKDNLIRVSVGIEDIDDILKDLSYALENA